MVVSLPLGLIGDPLAAATCTEVQLLWKGGEESDCPGASRVGMALLFTEGNEYGSREVSVGAVTDVYNMASSAGSPAQLGFKVLGKAITVYASVVHTSSGYVLRVAAPGVPRTLSVEGFGLIFFGNPGEVNNEPNNRQAFFTNPGDCLGGPVTARLETDSWAEPGKWSSAESVSYPQVTGCNLLQIAPTVEMLPEVTEAEAPSGFEIKIKSSQNPKNYFPELATPDLKNITMTLPEGMAVSPGAADGLVGCEATGPSGINMPGAPAHPNEIAGEGEEIGADGMSHLVRGHCPLASQVGTAQITTPLLKEPLEGHVYLAQPPCGGKGQPVCTATDAADGNLYGLYVEAEGSGVVIKLGGRISANPATGQLTARATNFRRAALSAAGWAS